MMRIVLPACALLLLIATACGTSAEEPLALQTVQQALEARAPTVIRIGALVDDASPARTNFTAAANLAESQINQGLAAAHSIHSVDVIVGYYGGATGFTQATRTIDMVNQQGIVGVVSDVSGSPGGTGGTVAVNRLNYESPSRIVRKVPVTCYQCSSAFFNDPAQSDLGFKDPDNWLWRTFFNATFESAVQVQLVYNRAGFGDFNGDGRTKIVIYYDAGHLSAATTMPGLVDSIYGSRPHSLERIQKTLPSTSATRAAELAKIFDGHNDSTGADDGLPDAVYLAFLPANIPESLGDYTGHAFSPKPPATANNGGRRDFLLSTLLANGGEGLEGNSVLVAAKSASGQAFVSSYKAANGGAIPELTASYLYDGIAAQALAALVAVTGGLTGTPEQIRAGLGAINQPNGTLVGATAAGFELAATRIRAKKPINYDGASSPLDLTATGEMYPDLVHWKIQGGKFVELESYRCDPSSPNCVVRP
jgi:hypothetical protein